MVVGWQLSSCQAGNKEMTNMQPSILFSAIDYFL